MESVHPMDRTNESWLRDLQSTGSAQHEALADLRRMLMSRLQKSFYGRKGVDDTFLEDVTQETLIKTLKKLNQFQGKSRFTTWATTIAVHVAYTELRRRRWKDISLEQILSDEGGCAAQADDGRPGPDVEFQQAVLVECLYRTIETELTDKQRTALLAELKGMPLEEIGRRMASNRNAIYKLTHDARKRLKQSLEAAGYSADDLQTV